MKNKLSRRAVITLSLLTASVVPSLAASGLSISDGTNSLSISNGIATCVGICSTSSLSAVAGTGFVEWTGVVGNFSFIGNGVTGKTAPNIAQPAVDLEVNHVLSTGAGGTLTIKWSDTGFTGAGPGTTTLQTTIGGGGSITYSTYFDASNTLFGTATPVSTYTTAISELQALSGADGFAPGTPFSMTTVETIAIPGDALVLADESLIASLVPLTVNCAVSSAQVNVPYTSAISVSGGSGGYTFQLLSGSLPTGLTLNTSTGVISGTPSVAGTNFNYVIQVTDSDGTKVSTSGCGIVVLAPNSNLSLSCPLVTAGTQGQPFSASLVANGGTQAYHFSIGGGGTCVNLDGLTLNASTGSISGTPSSATTCTYYGSVTDSTVPTHLTASTLSACILNISPSLSGPPVGTGDTATIGFWHNKNGQALILSLGGSSTNTALAAWLATNYPYLYGANAGAANNLTGKNNLAVAAYFMTLFGASGQKTQAQILAGALAAYVTNSGLAGTVAKNYGFNSSPTGTGAKTYNVGAYGTAIGLNNGQAYTVAQLLAQVNIDVHNGTYAAAANAFNVIFSNINQTGDII